MRQPLHTPIFQLCYMYVQMLSCVLTLHAVNYSDLQCGDKLGESGLGATYKGFWSTKDVAVAIKFVASRLVAATKLDPDEVVELL